MGVLRKSPTKSFKLILCDSADSFKLQLRMFNTSLHLAFSLSGIEIETNKQICVVFVHCSETEAQKGECG